LLGSVAVLISSVPAQAVAVERTVSIGGFSLSVPESVPAALPSGGSPTQQSRDAEEASTGKAAPVEQASEFLVLNGAGDGTGVRVLKAAAGLMTPSQNTFNRSPGGDLSDRITVGGHLGAPTFFGSSLGWRFSDHFGVRSGFDWFSFSRSQSLSDLKYKVKLKMQSEPVFVDLYPWRDRSFRLSAGVLFNQNSLSGSLKPTSAVNLGGTVFPAGTAGTLRLKIKQKPVSPVVAMGGNLFYFDSAHQWGFSSEIGAYYAGKPDVDYKSTAAGAASAAQAERQSIKNSIGNKLNIIPVIQTGINFSF
jgi:hypothetical protein